MTKIILKSMETITIARKEIESGTLEKEILNERKK